jgi:hypothetical protein
MIRIVISRNSAGSISSMKIDGHSGYAEQGADIICSAVSVTAYTAAGALEDLAGLKGCYSESSGQMTISLPDGMDSRQAETAAIIMETTAIGFKQIELSYGKYVSVMDEEV